MIKRTFKEIIQVLRFDIESRMKDEEYKKVFDKQIAKELNVTGVNFAVLKQRGSIPYEEVLDYCAKHKLNAVDVFYKDGKND